MPTAIIAEDEPILCAELRHALSALWPELDIVAETMDGVSTIRTVQAIAPDVVFLDINMPGLTGLEVAKVVQGKTAVVFVTAYNQHALEAYDLGASDYLVKPLNRGRLLQTIERLKANLTDRRSPLPMPDAALATPRAAHVKVQYIRWIQASIGNLLRLITTDEVFYFQADAKYTRVVTAQAEALIRKPIKDLVNELDPDDFRQVNRGAIVNLRRVEAIFREDGYMEVRLKERSERLTVSTGYQSAFRQL